MGMTFDASSSYQLNLFLYGHWGEYTTISIATHVSYGSIDTVARIYKIKVEICGLPLWKLHIIHDLPVLIVAYTLI